MTSMDLTLPAFLDRRGQKPAVVRTRRHRDRVPPRPRPEGERWENAPRFEVYIESTEHHMPRLACGLRRVWVVEGRLWARLHDGEQQAKISMRDWSFMKRKAKEIVQ